MTSEFKQASLLDGRAVTQRRLRCIEEWRRARFCRLLDGPDHDMAIRAARLYLEVGAQRMAVERALL
ncbi:hypothetical protein [Bradyrhizobium australafricanum]|uniref:hypothetical protein n=1 Tax=Bradyrhizobium australafricanum TaxID=2821406 RepID=UPI001CE380BB|nr:hypothetical protein [Bradyrhizobium australafricanum]MCA6104750.1 hypothetical protein [Bradyrhizobium australafricanum]